MNTLTLLPLALILAELPLSAKIGMPLFRSKIKREVESYMLEMIPGVRISGRAEYWMSFSMPNNPLVSRFPLDELYEFIARKPTKAADRRRIYEEYVRPLIAGENLENLSVAEHGTRIFPRIIPTPADPTCADSLSLPQRPLGSTGFTEIYCVQTDNHFLFVRHRHIEKSGMSDLEMLDLAMANLREAFDPTHIEAPLNKTGMVTINGPHAPAFILLLAEYLPDDRAFLVIIPDKTSLFISPLSEDGKSLYLPLKFQFRRNGPYGVFLKFLNGRAKPMFK